MNTTFQHEHYSESLKAACWLPLRFKMFQFSNLRTFKLSNSQTMLFCKLYNIAKIKTSQFEKCDNGIFPRSRPASHKHIQLSQGVYMTQSQIMGENHFREYFLRTFSLVPKGRWCALQCVSECRVKCNLTFLQKLLKNVWDWTFMLKFTYWPNPIWMRTYHFCDGGQNVRG